MRTSRFSPLRLSKAGLASGLVCLIVACSSGPSGTARESSPHVRGNPWSPILHEVPPIRVQDPKAAAIGAVAAGREPVFEIALTDVGLHFGYIYPPIIVGYQMTGLALERLYPEGIPVRGRIRVASQSETDFMLAASYITGARPFYFVRGVAASDLVVDPSLRRPDAYVMVFQRKDTGRAVRVQFNRKALLPDDDEYHFLAGASINLLNNLPMNEAQDARRRMLLLMEKALSTTQGVYETEMLEEYRFPDEPASPPGSW